MTIFQGIAILLVIFGGCTNGKFDEVVEYILQIYEAGEMTSAEAVLHLDHLNSLLNDDIENNDAYLSGSLVEISHVIDYIIPNFEQHKFSGEELLDVGKEILNISRSLLIGINAAVCLEYGVEEIDCTFTPLQAIPLIRTTDEQILRMLSFIVDYSEYEEVEMQEPNITASCIKARLQDIIQREKVGSYLGIPNVPENEVDEQENVTVKIFTVRIMDDVYTFVLGPKSFNVGVVKTFLRNSEGQYIEVFGAIDIFIDASEPLNNPYYTTTGNSSNDDQAVIFVSAESNLDGGIMKIQMSSIQECTTYAVWENLNFNITTKERDVILNDTSPDSIKVTFRNQTITMVIQPPIEPLDFNVYCEACMQMADIVFILDNSFSMSRWDVFLSKLFVISVVEGLDIGPGKVRVSVLRFNQITEVIFHLNEYDNKADVINAIRAVDNSTDFFTNTAGALHIANTMVFTPYDRGVQQIAYVLTDGASNDKNMTIVRAEEMRAAGIDIIAVGIGDNVDKDEINNIADDPDEYRAFFVQTSDDLEYLATSIVGVVCRGKWTNLTSPKADFGEVSSYKLNEDSYEWERGVGMQLNSLEENTVVFTSNYFGTFGVNILAIPPETIDFEEAISNIDEKIADSPIVLATIIFLLSALALGTVALRRLDRRDEKMWMYQPLRDNPDDAEKYYFVSIHTGLWSAGRLEATPFIILKGWYGETDVRAMKEKGNTIGNLQRWKYANYAVGVNKDIGPLTELKIWHDGESETSRWYLDKVLIRDGDTGDIYTFLCGDWLAADRGDGKTYRQLYPAQEEFKDGKILFTSITRFKLFDDYLWLSMFSRPSFSRFTRVQRLYCCACVLALAMLVSAMWFRTDEGAKTYGISIGPVSINYKQVFVGCATVVISAPALLIISFIFRNRKFQNELEQSKYTEVQTGLKEAIIPWWGVFIGYGVAVGGIASGCVFSFFYSLQWGKDLSTAWILSLLFGTTNNVVFLQPLSVVMTCVILAGIFKGSAKKNITEMAPLLIDETHSDLLESDDIPSSKWPGGLESNSVKQIRRQYILDRRLYTHLRGLFLQILFIGTLGIICLHNCITDTYHQNDALIQLLKPQKQINSTDDIWSWLQDYYFDRVFPKRWHNGKVLFPRNRQFMTDFISYRMGPVRLRQKRVTGQCNIPDIMTASVGLCNPKLSPATEDKRNYCPGWTNYLGQCEKSGFEYTHANSTSAFTYFGTYGIYDGGGYVKDMNPFEFEITIELQKLKSNNWIDNRTRFFVAENAVVNANKMLFSLVSFRFELSELGGIEPNFRVQTSKLYPYIDAWDYIVLGLQCIFVLVTFIRTLMFFYDVWSLKFRVLTSVSSCGILWSIVLSIAAIACYIARIDRTIFTIDEIFNSAGQFMTFEIVQLLDDVYKATLGTVLFIQILFLLKPLTFNYYLYMMKSTIVLSRSDLLSFGIFIMIPLAAFSSLVYCFLGSQSYSFRTFFSSFVTLVRTMLAMTKFRDTFGYNAVGNDVIFAIFIFSMSILLVNMFICILNDAFAFINQNKDGGGKVEPFDKKLNAHFWMKMGKAFNFCSSGKNDDADFDAEPEEENEEKFNQRVEQMDQMIEELFKKFSV